MSKCIKFSGVKCTRIAVPHLHLSSELALYMKKKTLFFPLDILDGAFPCTSTCVSKLLRFQTSSLTFNLFTTSRFNTLSSGPIAREHKVGEQEH